MAFNIDAFTAEMHSVGFARPSDFEVEIGGDILSKVGGSFGLSSSLMLRVNSAIIPGRDVQNSVYLDYGAPYKVGTKLNYVDIPISIICSPDLREREFFMRWQDLIGGLHRNPGLNADDRKKQFNSGYYDDYVCKKGITIYKLDQQGFKTYAVDLIDAYPVNINAMALSWSSGAEMMKLDVTFSYRYYEERDQSKLGTQLRIGKDGLQIAGGLNLPFSIAGIKNQAKTQLNPRKLMTQLGRKSGVNFTGLPKIGNLF